MKKQRVAVYLDDRKIGVVLSPAPSARNERGLARAALKFPVVRSTLEKKGVAATEATSGRYSIYTRLPARIRRVMNAAAPEDARVKRGGPFEGKGIPYRVGRALRRES